MRMRPSSHGPPPNPPSTGMETAAATAAPATGPELVKSSKEAPASSRRLASSTSFAVISAGTCAPGFDAALYGMPNRRAVQLDHIGARVFDEHDGRPDGAPGALLQRAEREIAAHQRTLNAAADGLADYDHLAHRDFQGIRTT